jgi:hypothetical protein
MFRWKIASPNVYGDGHCHMIFRIDFVNWQWDDVPVTLGICSWVEDGDTRQLLGTLPIFPSTEKRERLSHSPQWSIEPADITRGQSEPASWFVPPTSNEAGGPPRRLLMANEFRIVDRTMKLKGQLKVTVCGTESSERTIDENDTEFRI